MYEITVHRYDENREMTISAPDKACAARFISEIIQVAAAAVPNVSVNLPEELDPSTPNLHVEMIDGEGNRLASIRAYPVVDADPRLH